MNKKLIALAVAAAVTAPVAMADVVLYGRAHVDVRMTDDGTNDYWSVNSNASRLGFKGSEDLGNGLKAIFKYEMNYDVSGATRDNTTGAQTRGNSITGARNAYLGLAGGFGSLTVGNHDTPAKSAYYAAGNDHLSDSIIDLNQTGGFSQDRSYNAITYWSPSFSGLKVGAQIQPGEGVTTNNGLADGMSVGVTYKGHGLKAGAGYQVTPGTEDEKMFQVGASYTISNVTFGANYETNDDHGGTANAEHTAMALAVKAQFGNNALIANYGNQETENGVTTADKDRFGLALQHTLSKRSSVYVAFSTEEDDVANSEADYFGIGMTHNF